MCTAALLWAQCTPHCSWLPCKVGSQQASVTAKTPVKVYCCCFRNSQQTLCHSNSTYRDVVFIQVCSDPTPVVVLQHCPGQNAVPNVLCCCTRQAHSMRCVMHYTYVGWLFVQVCRDPTPMHIQVCSDPAHCSKVQGKTQSPLFSAALQNRLGSRQCVTAFTHMEICSSYRCAVTQQCSKVQGKMQTPLFSDGLQNRLTSGSVSLHLHIWRFALHTGAATPMHCSIDQGKMQFPLFQCRSAKQTHSRHCDNAVTPVGICPSYRCAVLQHQCIAALVRAKCIPHSSVLLFNTGSQQAL